MLDNTREFLDLFHTVTELAKAGNEDELVQLLSSAQWTIRQTDYDNWNGGIYGYTIDGIIDVQTFIRLKDRVEEIERSLAERFNFGIRHIDNERIEQVSIIPKSFSLSTPTPSPHRPFTAQEVKRRLELTNYLNRVSEDKLIEEILLPLFRQLGFHRVTASGHKDKALEYGKDIWMKYTLPTQHILYFGIQVKKGKLDAAGTSKEGNTNMGEIYNQVLMLLGQETFDPDTSKRVLVDHAFIVAGGEITKAARHWLGNRLDVSKRSQILFMDRDDILNLYIVTNLPLPAAALPTNTVDDDLPF